MVNAEYQSSYNQIHKTKLEKFPWFFERVFFGLYHNLTSFSVSDYIYPEQSYRYTIYPIETFLKHVYGDTVYDTETAADCHCKTAEKHWILPISNVV
jgi:hypothetical protein